MTRNEPYALCADPVPRREEFRHYAIREIPYAWFPDRDFKRMFARLADSLLARNAAMYESDNIIAYLHEHYGNGTAPTTAVSGLRIHRSNESCDVCD